MAAIVLEGVERIPVRYEGWPEWRVELLTPRDPIPLIAPGTGFCAMCWGSGHIHHEAMNGEGLVPRQCLTCRGSGVVRLSA
jgi:hypothetical protein